MAGYSASQLGIKAPSGGFQDNAWYQGRNYDAASGTFGDTGQIWSGNSSGQKGSVVSNETASQTNPNNVSFIQQQREIKANQIQPLTNFNMGSSDGMNGLNAQVETYRMRLEEELKTRSEENKALKEQTRARENEALEGINQQTQPFMEEMSEKLREQYKTEEDVQARLELGRQTLNIYNEVEALIREQKGVTGLASVRNPRVQKTIEDGMARIGSHQAAIASLDGNIALANNEIDRALGFVQADRQNRITYFNNILNLTNRDILNLDEKEKTIANEQLNLLKNDLDRAQKSADYIKNLMINPDTALAMAQSGVTFNDDIGTINKKLATYQYSKEIRDSANAFTTQGYTLVTDPKKVPAGQLKSFVDSMGKTHYYKEPTKPLSQTDLNAQAKDWAMDVALNGSAKVKADSGKQVEVTSEDLNTAMSVFEKTIAPQFSARIGTIFTDSYGRKWQSTSRGWVLI